ncbi:hypothetical protein [Paracoccus sp. NSM]|uniref:hypothetical protein n=1 Tax=Paracoccus sp. NSM TaxID=3457784 RepID=UPI0040350DE0
MNRSVFFRTKSPVGPWQRYSGALPFNVTGFQAGVVLEYDIGDGVIREITTSAFDPDAQALFNRFEIAPELERKQLISDRFIAGKATTWWSKLDALWVHAAHAPEAGRLNWLSPNFNCLPVNNPSFEVDRGYTGDGVSSYLDSQFNPAVQVPLGSKFQRDSASMGVRSNTDNQSAGSLIGFFDGTSGVSMNPRNANNGAAYRVNQGTQLTSSNGTSPSAVGMFAVTRTAANAVALYRQGGLIASGTTASNPVANGNLRLGAITDTSLRSCQFAMGWIGGGLTADEVQSIFEWFQPYRTALGIE